MAFTFIFIVLNIINSVLLTTIGYGVSTWQYWMSSVCVCGAYLVGCWKYIFKNED